MLAPLDQPTTELIVRLTARLSAALFAAAVILFAAGYPHDQRRLRRRRAAESVRLCGVKMHAV